MREHGNFNCVLWASTFLAIFQAGWASGRVGSKREGRVFPCGLRSRYMACASYQETMDWT